MKGLTSFKDLDYELKKIMQAIRSSKLSISKLGDADGDETVLRSSLDTVAPLPDKGFEQLKEKKGSSSTPYSTRTQRAASGEEHDSGFKDSLVWSSSQASDFCSQDSGIAHCSFLSGDIQDKCNEAQVDLVSDQNEQVANFTQNSVTSDPMGAPGAALIKRDHVQTMLALERQQAYYDNLAQKCARDKYIGLRMGREWVDIMAELHQKKIPCIKTILGYLSDKDLSSVSRVSSIWASICSEHGDVKARLESLANTKSLLGKENGSPEKEPVPSITRTTLGVPLGPAKLQENIRPLTSTSLPKKSTTLFERYVEEGKSLRVGEKLTRCVRCKSPAKLVPGDRAKCTMIGCLHDFCTRCDLEYHGARDCITQKTKKTRITKEPINSKKSKQQLRRNL